ncbi:MAG: hypothetical protein AB7T74_14925 [Clostridia bacterium]
MMKKEIMLSLAVVIAMSAALSIGASPVYEENTAADTRSAIIETTKNPVDHTTYGWALETAKKNADGTVTIRIMEVPNFEEKRTQLPSPWIPRIMPVPLHA